MIDLSFNISDTSPLYLVFKSQVIQQSRIAQLVVHQTVNLEGEVVRGSIPICGDFFSSQQLIFFQEFLFFF